MTEEATSLSGKEPTEKQETMPCKTFISNIATRRKKKQKAAKTLALSLHKLAASNNANLEEVKNVFQVKV